jgi:hypothetical protein
LQRSERAADRRVASKPAGIIPIAEIKTAWRRVAIRERVSRIGTSRTTRWQGLTWPVKRSMRWDDLSLFPTLPGALDLGGCKNVSRFRCFFMRGQWHES